MQPGGWVRIHALQKHACWPNVLRTYAPSGALSAAVGTANGASRAGGDCPGGAWPAGRTRPPTDATPPAALLRAPRAPRPRVVEPVETPREVEDRPRVVEPVETPRAVEDRPRVVEPVETPRAVEDRPRVVEPVETPGR